MKHLALQGHLNFELFEPFDLRAWAPDAIATETISFQEYIQSKDRIQSMQIFEKFNSIPCRLHNTLPTLAITPGTSLSLQKHRAHSDLYNQSPGTFLLKST